MADDNFTLWNFIL